MHIDWFVFFSQIVNFLILLFLLKKFLYGRIIGAIDARKAKIGALFAEAEQSRRDARTAAEDCERKRQDLEERYEQSLNEARKEAETYQERLMEKAREEVDYLKVRWTEALRSERNNFLHELRQLAGRQIYAATRRVLKDLADLNLEERIVEVLLARIASMDENERSKFQGPAREGGTITVTCAFDIPPATQARLNDTLHRYLSGDMDVAYVRSDDILSGCELRSDGHKISWSMKDYLDTIEERFYSALYEEAQEQRT